MQNKKVITLADSLIQTFPNSQFFIIDELWSWKKYILWLFLMQETLTNIISVGGGVKQQCLGNQCYFNIIYILLYLNILNWLYLFI